MSRLPHPRLALFAVSLALLPAACADGTRAEPAGPPRAGGGAGSPVPVVTAKVQRKAMPLQLSVVGTVEPSSTVAVRAQITGELTSVNFTEGDDVTQGQVLFTLDRRPLEAALKQAEANLARDQAQLANAQAQAQRIRDLAARGIATREQVETSGTTAAALEATVGANRAAVENAAVQLQYATIHSPISGRTGSLMVHPGNLVRANDGTPLVVINQVTPVNVSFGIPEGQLSALRKHMAQGSLRVEAHPSDEDLPAVGRIAFIDNAVDPSTGAIKIKGSFTNSDRRLWPGQFVNVVVTLATDPAAIVVPTVAVQNGPQGTFVFVVNGEQKVDVRPVVVARTSGVEAVIGRGLEPGETVVTDGQLRLVPGSAVRERAEASAADAKVSQ